MLRKFRFKTFQSTTVLLPCIQLPFCGTSVPALPLTAVGLLGLALAVSAVRGARRRTGSP